MQGGMLILDESEDEKSGDSSGGAGRQHNGRMGKVDEAQVGVYLAYAKKEHWTLWDGCLFLPEKWFSASAAGRRAKAEIPSERYFQTKVELACRLKRWRLTVYMDVAIGCGSAVSKRQLSIMRIFPTTIRCIGICPCSNLNRRNVAVRAKSSRLFGKS